VSNGDAGSEWDELAVLVHRAVASDRDAIRGVRAYTAVGFDPWPRLTGLTADVRTAWVQLSANGDAARQLDIERQLRREQAELVAAGAGSLEMLLAERATLASLRVRYLDEIAGAADGRALCASEQVLRMRAARRGHRAAIRLLRVVQQLLGDRGCEFPNKPAVTPESTT